MSKLTNVPSVSAMIKTIASIYNRIVASDTEVAAFNSNKTLYTDGDGRIAEGAITKAEIDKLTGIDGLTGTVYASYPVKSGTETISGTWTLTEGAKTGHTDVLDTASSYTIADDGGEYVILADTTTTPAALSILLPTAADNEGRHLYIKDAGGGAAANNISIYAEAAGETIDGTDRSVIPLDMNVNYMCVHLFCDGTKWHII